MCQKCSEVAAMIRATENIRGSYVEGSFPGGPFRLVVPWKEGDVIPSWGDRPLSASEARDLNSRGYPKRYVPLQELPEQQEN
jgi:hypothetical protein